MLCSKLFCVAHSACLGQWKPFLSRAILILGDSRQRTEYGLALPVAVCLMLISQPSSEPLTLSLIAPFGRMSGNKIGLEKCQSLPVPLQQKIQLFCQQLLSPWYSQVIFTKLRNGMHCPALHFTSAKLFKIFRVRDCITCRILNIIPLILKTCILYCRKINK